MASNAILGVSLGTRIVGLALLRSGELVEWHVKSFKHKWSDDKRAAIITSIKQLCELNGVRKIALKKIQPQHLSLPLINLQSSVISFAHAHKIALHQYALSDLAYENRGGRRTKKTLSEAIAKKHPRLRNAYLKEHSNRREYYSKMFEAIAIAEICK